MGQLFKLEGGLANQVSQIRLSLEFVNLTLKFRGWDKVY
jgi:hypothetical protein